jgi:CheY-like chemotaxis protein
MLGVTFAETTAMELRAKAEISREDVEPTLPAAQRSGSQNRLTAARARDADLVAGRYVLGAELGRGAMGVVHLALDTLLVREVAVKTFPTLSAQMGAAVDVAGEARALAAIHHHNVVTVYAFHADSQPPFLVMERAAGRRLDVALDDGRPFSVTRALRILRQIADGLDAIHYVRLVHGDVKAGNVLLDDDDHVKLVDVGLAPLLQRMSPGQMFGTTAYISPERALALVSEPWLATRSDVYSFGVLCFEMLTGRRPFLGDETAQLYAHAFSDPPRASEVAKLSAAFDAPLARALEKSPALRHATCGALVDELELASRGADEHGEPIVIVVADDEPDCVTLARAALYAGLPGAQVRSCASGAAALELAAEIAPTVVVLDLVMPGLSGVELVRAVRAAAPAAGIVVATGEGSGAERAATAELGVRSFLVKPYGTDELVRAVHLAASPEPARRESQDL